MWEEEIWRGTVRLDVYTTTSSRCSTASGSTAEIDTLSLVDKFIDVSQALVQFNLLVQSRLDPFICRRCCHRSNTGSWGCFWDLGFQSSQEFSGV
jgi:hypothetical protein